MQWYQAPDPFVIELDGVPVSVPKGKTLPETDPVVRHDLANGGKLFRPLDMGAEEPPEPKPRSAAARAAAKVTGKAAG